MLEIQIVKVEDPGCLWARVLKGPGVHPDSPEEYESLRVRMNLFYHNVELDVQQLKPAELREGLVCVVFSVALKSWCRAVVESVAQGPVDTQAWCLLVDHGERMIVREDDVRTPLEKFLLLPFRVRRFSLSGVRPVTLQVSFAEDTAALVPSLTWDSSATKYLHNLLQVSTLAEAVLCEACVSCSSIELYLTINSTKICVNHELVAKKFACFLSDEKSSSRAPLSLAWDIYSSPHQLLEMKGCCPVKQQSEPAHTLIETEREHQPHTEVEQQKAEASDEDLFSSPVKPELPKLSRNPGTYTIGRGWRIRSEAVDIFTAETGGSPYVKCNTLLHSKLVPESEENPCSADQTDSITSAASGSSEEQKQADSPQEPSLDDQLICSRLMQFLNPDPLNPDPESVDAKVVRCDPGHSGVLVHSALHIEPCSNLTRAPISEPFRKFLLWRKYPGPSVAESYCWPAVARGFDTVLVSQRGDDPLSYIPPLLMLLQTVSVASSLAARTGPVAVILCPGWEKVQTVLELLEDSKAAHNLHPTSVLLGLDQDEPKKFKIQRNCQLLVTTPFSMTRLLDAQCFLFLRLCHLVLDEADVLYSQAPEQMSVVLKHFQKLVSTDERGSCPRQIIAAAGRWSNGIDALVREHMTHPSVIITVMEEAALYGRVHQRVQLCLDCEKISVLLSSLDFHPPKPQKTLIITSSREETEHVHKAVGNTAVFTLKAHEDMTDQFDFIIDQWRKDIGQGTQVILVTTDDCLKALGIRDASCVVHYGFPGSPKLFGSRLFCMSENFRRLSDAERGEGPCPAAQSVLLLSELNARHVCGVLRYLRRTGAVLPPELQRFALGVQQAKEEQKTERPLCLALKSFGFCRDSTVCPDRHMINTALDQPKHPASGTITVLPLNIKTANVYCGRIVSQKDDAFESLAARMKTHYSGEKRCAVEVLEGALYAVQEEDNYCRVRVMEVPEKGDQLFSSVTACFIDEGRTQEVKSHQLLQLPVEFQDLPGQAVEIILCRVQPVDGEVDWNPKVTRGVSLRIRGKLHQARAVLSVGDSVWVDPMVRMTRVPGLKTFINEYNVHSEILASGFGVNNPQHLELLKTVLHGEQSQTEHRSERVSSVDSDDLLTSRMKEILSRHHDDSNDGMSGLVKEVLNHHRDNSSDGMSNGMKEVLNHHHDDSNDGISGLVKEVLNHHRDASTDGMSNGLKEVLNRHHDDINDGMSNLMKEILSHHHDDSSNEMSNGMKEMLSCHRDDSSYGMSNGMMEVLSCHHGDSNDGLSNLMKEVLSSHRDDSNDGMSNLMKEVLCHHHDDSTDGMSNGVSSDAICLSGVNGLSVSESGDTRFIKHSDEEDISPSAYTPQTLRKPAGFSFQPAVFHPQIKWFQRSDSVTVYIKIINPVMQKCEFSTDTVIYSGFVNERQYLARLDLFGDISADESSWEMKCNEPVLRLKKKEPRDWRTLLKHKSSFVSYEFDYIEEAHNSSVNGHWFLAAVGEDGCYVSSESDSD